MYYQLRRGSKQKKSPIRISFKKYSKIWRLISASFMKTINFAISFPIVVLLLLIIPITLVFKWIVSLAHRIACLGGTYIYDIDFKLSNTFNILSRKCKYINIRWKCQALTVRFCFSTKKKINIVKNLFTFDFLSETTL